MSFLPERPERRRLESALYAAIAFVQERERERERDDGKRSGKKERERNDMTPLFFFFLR